MPPGRALDSLIAEQVMGLENVRFQEQEHGIYLVYGTNDQAGVSCRIPNYSTDISDAWEVVDKMLSKELEFTLKKYHSESQWLCSFSSNHILGFSHESAPHAICLAALGVVSGLNPQLSTPPLN